MDIIIGYHIQEMGGKIMTKKVNEISEFYFSFQITLLNIFIFAFVNLQKLIRKSSSAL